MPFPEPTGPPAPRAEVLLGYLDYFRSLVVSKVQGLSDAQLRVSLLPSGWTVLELVKHLTHVEQRWLVWGFEGQPVARPWGDSQDSQDGRWYVSDTEDGPDLVRALQAQGAVTSSVVRAHELSDIGRPGERWEGAAPPTLGAGLVPSPAGVRAARRTPRRRPRTHGRQGRRVARGGPGCRSSTAASRRGVTRVQDRPAGGSSTATATSALQVGPVGSRLAPLAAA